MIIYIKELILEASSLPKTGGIINKIRRNLHARNIKSVTSARDISRKLGSDYSADANSAVRKMVHTGDKEPIKNFTNNNKLTDKKYENDTINKIGEKNFSAKEHTAYGKIRKKGSRLDGSELGQIYMQKNDFKDKR